MLEPGGRLVIIDKNRAKRGALETERWEKWFEVEEILIAPQELGVKVRAEYIAYEDREADELFVCCWGRKRDA